MYFHHCKLESVRRMRAQWSLSSEVFDRKDNGKTEDELMAEARASLAETGLSEMDLEDMKKFWYHDHSRREWLENLAWFENVPHAWIVHASRFGLFCYDCGH